VASTQLERQTRLAAALFFKNFIRRNWTDEEGNYKIAIEDCFALKQQIIGLLITVPPYLQIQLGEAVSIMADSDFPERWDNLVDDLVQRLSPTDLTTNLGVLTIAHSIFRRWRPLFRSDALFLEIKHVLERFARPYMDIFMSTDALIAKDPQDVATLQLLFQNLHLLLKVYYDLNCQDIPEFFEDNLETFMGLFLKYVNYINPLLNHNDDDESGILDRTKSSVCEILELYTQKYEDVFAALPRFVEAIWNLLTTVDNKPKHDILASKAFAFLTSVVKIQKHAQLFANEDILTQVVERIILPNMSLRESDEELFEDEPIEYIRRDLEGSDSDTRRRSAADFLRTVMEQFERLVTSVVSRYISHFLGEYQKNSKANWRSKDTALYLFTSIAAKGVVSSVGVTSTNLLVDVVEFFNTNIVPDLTASVEEVHPILKVDSIKYVYTFRNQLTPEQLFEVLPLLSKHLKSENYEVYTYAAITLDRTLCIQRNGHVLFGKSDIAPLLQQLLTDLFAGIEKGSSPEKLAENEYLMRCALRVILTAKADIAPLTEVTLSHMTKIILEISKNPSNPRFNHYCFEALGGLVRYAASSDVEALASFEKVLLPLFVEILKNDVSEFMPYVFQLMSQLLEPRQGTLPPAYDSFIQPLLTPALWEAKGNVPALARLLQSILRLSAPTIVQKNQINPILGIFQKLTSSKSNDTYGFDILESTFLHIPMANLTPSMKQIFYILLVRLNTGRTERFALRFTKFILFLASHKENDLGPEFVIKSINSIESGILVQLFESIVVPRLVKMQKNDDKKLAVVGASQFLCNSPSMQQEPLVKVCIQLVLAILSLLENPDDLTATNDGDLGLLEFDMDDASFGASFSKLSTTSTAVRIPGVDVKNPKLYFAEHLNMALSSYPGLLGLARQELTPEVRHVLTSYGVHTVESCM